jgi:ATP adenylyltransferase
VKECRYADPNTPGSRYIVVLNKFPIIENHFILASKEFVEQTKIREQDVRAVYAFLTAWESVAASRKLFAFFNCGPSSGASQPHLHVQFLPVDDIKSGDETGEWDLLVDSILPLTSDVEIAKLPLLAFVQRFPEHSRPDDVARIFADLQSRTKKAWSKYHQDSGSPDEDEKWDEVFSFNMGMTTEGIVLAPRVREAAQLTSSDGREIGSVALNGTMLGGTLIVRRREEWDFLRSTPGVLDDILRQLGISWDPIADSEPETAPKPVAVESKRIAERL